MRKFVAALVPLVVAVGLFGGQAKAIEFGTPDGNDHPGVGHIVFYDAAYVPVWRCSGSLVSRSVVLTAAHCAGAWFNSSGDPVTPSRAQVWFDQGPIPQGTEWAGKGTSCAGPRGKLLRGWPCGGGDALGTPHAHPDWDPEAMFPPSTAAHDIGVVVLDKQVRNRGILPVAPFRALDVLTRLAPRALELTIVGYGTQVEPPVDTRQRMQGTAELISLKADPGDFVSDSFMVITNDREHGGVACDGDSGGPVLFRGVIVGINSLVSGNATSSCEGVAWPFRTDVLESQIFLARYGVYPSLLGLIGSGGGRGDDRGESHSEHGGHGKRVLPGGWDD